MGAFSCCCQTLQSVLALSALLANTFQTGVVFIRVLNENGAEQNQMVDICVRKKETFVDLGLWSLVVLCSQNITFYADSFREWEGNVG